jgi:mannose-1-phosphate guanylyltransferase/mannose-6-phosphate isomerase
MTTQYLVYKDDSLTSALKVIEHNNSGFALIVDDHHYLIGTLTDGDIRRALIKFGCLDILVSDICAKKFEYLNTNSTFQEIVEKFRSRKVNFLPILDTEGKLVNLITKKNFQIMLLEDFDFNLLKDFTIFDNKMLEHEIFYRPWGFYKSTLLSEFAQSKIITLFPKQEFSLQEHKMREEHWLIIKGEGRVRLGDSTLPLYPGKYVFVPKGCKHKMINDSKTDNLIFSEVQLGEYFGEDDIIRYDDIYGRNLIGN